MSKEEWLKQYKHPKWQKRRLEILNIYGFKCCSCHEENITLHVHHKWYNKGSKVWEYEDECFLVLCESCHENWHSMKKDFMAGLVDTLIRGGWDVWDIDYLEILTFNGQGKDIVNFINKTPVLRDE